MRLCVAKTARGANRRKGPPEAERPLDIKTQSRQGFGETGR
jgi:hypothetical protein